MPNSTQAILELLTDKTKLAGADASKHRAALDALIQVDPNTVAFDNALKDHKDFWKSVNDSIEIDEFGVRDDAEFIIDNAPEASPSRAELRQAAVEQRVLLGLKAAPREVLIAILTNNPAECRAYLATKPETFGPLTDSVGWNKSVTPPAPTPPPFPGMPTPPPARPLNYSVEVLSDEAVQRIQQEAIFLHVLQVIKRPGIEYNDVLALIQAVDKTEMPPLAQKIGVHAAFIAHVQPFNESEQQELKQAWAKAHYLEYIRQIPSNALLDMKEALESQDFEQVQARLDPVFKANFQESDTAFVVGHLAARYLEVYLANDINHQTCLDLINGSQESFKTALKEVLELEVSPEQDYVDLAIATDSTRIKRGLAQGIIYDSTFDQLSLLQAMNHSKNVNDFRAALGALGIKNTDWVQEEDRQFLQRHSLRHSWSAVVDEASQFSSRAHLELVRWFDRLPLEKKQALLKKPTEVHHILNATTQEALEQYLGVPLSGEDSEKLLTENKRYAGLKQIHNREIAARLESYDCLHLDEEQIEEINQIIDEIPWNDEFDYVDFINKITTSCELEFGNIDALFGLSVEVEEGEEITVLEQDVFENIKNQSLYNAELYALAQKQPQDKAFIERLMTLEKLEPLSEANSIILINHFNRSANLSTFFSNLPKDDIKEQLLNEFTGNEFEQIKQSKRINEFKNQLDTLSKFGAEGHPALINAFGQLSAQKQVHLSKTEQLVDVLNASDAVSLTTYLGGEVELDAIIAEQARLSTFKPIINAEIAKILAQGMYPAGLTRKQVNAINTIIILDEDYSDKVRKISNMLVQSGANASGIINAFGYDPINLEYRYGHPAFGAYTQQQEFNGPLIEELNKNPGSVNKDLITILLGIKKEELFSEAQITSLGNQFAQSKDLQAFINSFPNTTREEWAFKNALLLECTQASFNAMKIKEEVGVIYNNLSPEGVKTKLENITTHIETLRQSNKSVGKSADLYKFVHKINPLHLCDAVFQSQGDIHSTKEEYEELAQDCTNTLDLLKSNKAKLEAYKASLEHSIGNPETHRKVDEQRVKILRKIEDELIVVNQQLDKFQQIQEKLLEPGGILPTLEKAAKGKKNYYYNSEGFSVSLDNAPVQVSSGATSATAGSKLVFTSKEAFKDNARYHFSRTTTNDQGVVTATTTGSFVESRPADGSLSTSRNETVSKTVGSQFVVDKPLKTDKPNTKVSDQDKADFYMGMAIAILARYKDGEGPTAENPIRLNGSNKEEIAHLWSAFVVLGEKGPSSMRFGREAISVDSGPFNPASQRKKTLGIETWSPDSLYKQIYTNKAYGIAVGTKIGHLKDLSEAEKEHKGALTAAEKNMEKYKKKMGAFRDEAQQVNKVGAGAAPPSPVAPSEEPSSIITPPSG